MDIILINTMAGAIGVGLFIGLILAIGYNLIRRKKIKKYNLLRIKQFGGVDLTVSEEKFLQKNCQLYGKITMGIFDTRRFTFKNIKQQTKTFFLKLSPFYKYKVKISGLEKNVKNRESEARYYRDKYHTQTQNIKVVMDELEELKNPKKKQTVPEFVEKAQDYDKSSLIPFSTARATSKFV